MTNNSKNHQARSNNSSLAKTSNKGSTNNMIINEESNARYYLIPIFIILCIVPLLSRMKIYNTDLSQFPWFSSDDQKMDFFLYYKHWAFVIVSAIMAVACAIKTYIDRKTIKLLPVFIPLAVYAILAILSTLFSDYIIFSLRGSFEMFESIFALLGYCIIVYYAYLFLKSEKDFKTVFHYIVGITLVMCFIGVLQFFKLDIFHMELGKNILIPVELRGAYDITFAFGENRVYTTLYNPNYVGVFAALLLPIIIVMLFYQKKILPIIILIVALIGLVICVIGSQSLSGFVGIVVSVFFVIILMWRYLVKRYYISIPVITLMIVGFILFNNYNDNYFSSRIISSLQETKTEYDLTDIHTEDNYVSLTYKNNELRITVSADAFGVSTIYGFDADNNTVAINYDPTTAIYTVIDERFSNITLGLDASFPGAFFIKVSDVYWLFTNSTEDGNFRYINRFGKFDKIVTAPSAVFTGNESFASGRGYIWSRTIPMLKDYMLLGSGPDTYAMAFPQQDYFNLYQFGFGTQILNKPHNMYLQMAVQTGVLSLIAFLVFYMIYFVSSFKLYIRGIYTTFYAKLGVAVFIGTISYMVVGLTNDSTVNTAPIYWTLVGIGIVLNMKVKPLIKEDIEELRKEKKNIKNNRTE